MAATVWMRHPTLPPEQLVEVPEISVPHHQAAGWEVTEAPAPPKPPARKAAAAEEPVPPQEPDGDGEAPADNPGDPASAAESATTPKRPRKTALKAEES